MPFAYWPVLQSLGRICKTQLGTRASMALGGHVCLSASHQLATNEIRYINTFQGSQEIQQTFEIRDCGIQNESSRICGIHSVGKGNIIFTSKHCQCNNDKKMLGIIVLCSMKHILNVILNVAEPRKYFFTASVPIYVSFEIEEKILFW